ncbi:helix-turn-helix transcriptional regulator [Arcanobacterium hippocoleae]
MFIMSQHSEIERLIAKSLAKTIRKRREELHLSQEQVAYKASIDRSHYQIIEAGLANRKTRTPANPRLNTLLQIADTLDCSIIDLLKETSDLYEKIQAQVRAAANQKYFG